MFYSKLKRKILTLTVVIMVITALILSGCGNQTSSTGNSGEQVTLNFVHWRPEDVSTFNKIIAEFEKKYPNIKVQQTAIPSANYYGSLQSMVLSGQGADVFTSFPGSQFITLSGANAYADLGDLTGLKNIDPNLIKMGQKNGKQYAIAYQLVFNDPVYNKDIFKKYNISVPQDWNSFISACETLKKNNVTPILFTGNVSPRQLVNSLMMNYAPNEDIFDQVMQGKAKVTDPWFVQTLQRFKDLVPYMEPGALGVSQDGASALFAQGKGAMLALGSYQMAAVKKQNPNINQGLLVPMTVPASQAKWDGIFTSTFMLGINAKSSHIDAAKKFVDFLLQPDVAQEYANATGQMVTVNNVKYNSPELTEAQNFQKEHKNLRFQPVFTIALQEVNDGVNAAIQKVIGGGDPVQAAQDLQAVVDKVRASGK